MTRLTGEFALIADPLTWVADKIGGFIDGVVGEGFEMLVSGLVGWVVDAVIWVVGGVFHYFIDATDPNVQADWFVGPDGPYATTAAIGATLMVGFVLAGIAHGALSGDAGGMLRRMALDLPMSVAGIVCLVTVTQVLIRITDDLSTQVMGNFEEDISDFIAVVTTLSRLAGPGASLFVIFVLGMITVLVGLTLVAELTVRAALVYIVVALAPLVFAAQTWPALKGVGQKMLRLLCGLILSKLAMAVALAVAASAAVGTGSGGEVTVLQEPETYAEDPGGSVTQAVGILLAAIAAFGIAAFMPFFIARLLPLAEDAAVAQGLRAGPMRATQQAASLAYYSRMVPDIVRRRSGPKGSGGPPRAGPKSSSTPGSRPSPSGLSGQKALGSGSKPTGALPAGPPPMPPGPGGTGGGPGGGRPGGGAGKGGSRMSPGGPGGGAGGAGGAGTAGAGGGGAAGASAAAGPVGAVVTAGVAGAKAVKNVIRRGADVAGRSAEQQVAPVANRPVTGPPAGARQVPNSEEASPPPWGSRPAGASPARRPAGGGQGGGGRRS